MYATLCSPAQAMCEHQHVRSTAGVILPACAGARTQPLPLLGQARGLVREGVNRAYYCSESLMETKGPGISLTCNDARPLDG